jgi:cation transport regulator ChaB
MVMDGEYTIDDLHWMQAKLKIAVAQEDYATASDIKTQIQHLTVVPMQAPSPPPMPPTAASPPFVSISSVCAKEGSAFKAALNAGIVRVNGVLTQHMASELLECLDALLEDALHDTCDGPDLDARRQAQFGNVLSRANRYDFKLSLEAPPVRAAVTAMLDTLQTVIADSLGEDALLYELGALISLPGAARQPVHPDTPIVAGKGTEEGVTILTAFCALQDIDETMGPTLFLPATHNSEAHSAFFTYENFDLAFDACDDDDDANDDDANEEHATRVAALLDSWSTWRADLSAGDVTLFDSRCLHAGSANTSPRRRVLFYFSFVKAEHASASCGTLLDSLRGKHTISDLGRPNRRYHGACGKEGFP